MKFMDKARVFGASALAFGAGLVKAAPIDLSAGIASIQSDVSGYAAAVAPAVVAVAAIGIGIKYAKKFLGKI